MAGGMAAASFTDRGRIIFQSWMCHLLYNKMRAGQETEFSDDLSDMFGALLSAYLQYTSTTSVINPGQPDDFQVFPNPVSDELFIQWQPSVSGNTATKCLISTLQGQPVMRIDIAPGINTVGVDALVPGIYLLHLNGAVRKVVVY